MAMTLRFEDHQEFHRAALAMGVCGALAGLAVHVVDLVFPGAAAPGSPWCLALLAGAAGYGAACPPARNRPRALIALVAVVLALEVALGLARFGKSETAGGAALALAFAALLARGGRRPLVVAPAAAAAALLMRFVYASLVAAGQDAHVPPWILAAAAGAAFGFVGVLGVVPRHLRLRRNRVAAAYAACRDLLGGEMRELAERGMGVWAKMNAEGEPESPVRDTIEDSVVRLFDVGRKWAQVESDGARTPAGKLVERMDAIQAKLERCEDAIARGQYQQAHAALAAQVRYLRDIAIARERVIARMHHYLAAMERLRLAVINHRSADASRLSSEVQPILEDLEGLGREIDCSSEAMGQVEADGDGPAAAAAAAAAPRPPAQA
jgi:hypothetical protein